MAAANEGRFIRSAVTHGDEAHLNDYGSRLAAIVSFASGKGVGAGMTKGMIVAACPGQRRCL